ncbi:hypothetical protein [Corynebacterium aurimucosum]|uniref:hypothetical protein n=1 Tax=Corynebacterium aurimucosum TaxID=169292 RepID=UPI00128D06BD|nr:hypothetical protein [Corynebacterium aurimucosum]
MGTKPCDEEIKFAEEKSVILPNTVDWLDFYWSRTADAHFTLSLVGMVSFLKRPDSALDLIKELTEDDVRYALRIKGRMPWEYPHV